ncbi:MAG: CARDB domain-containing protein [Patescibacteria group bacterium]
MDTETFSNKTRRVRAFIVIGFFALIALIGWLSVQIVAYTPSAFSSLASLAQGISQYKEAVFDSESLPITSGLTNLESGKTATITWEKDDRPGTYTFSYSCTDGVTLEIVSPEGMRSVSCDMRYSLGDTDSVTLVVDSSKTESTNLSYAISFMRANDIGPIRIGEQTVMILPSTTLAEEVKEEGAVLGETDKKEDEFVKDEIVTPETTKPIVVTQPTTEYVYEVPLSNPKGFTDLATRFIGTGAIVNGKFVAGSIERKDDGAIQFEIKNIGTKTSEPWGFSVTLPDGDTYTSPKQAALKPNERATITIGFATPDKTSHTFVVVVKVEDKVESNNSFKKVVNFTK